MFIIGMFLGKRRKVRNPWLERQAQCQIDRRYLQGADIQWNIFRQSIGRPLGL